MVVRGRHRHEAFLRLLDVHEQWSWVVVGANAVAGTWALAASRVTALRSPALWRFTVVAQLSIFVQVGLGVALVSGEGRQADRFHMFYGFVSIIAVGIIYSYRQQLHRWRFLLYGLGGLFLTGLALRAMVVGTPG